MELPFSGRGGWNPLDALHQIVGRHFQTARQLRQRVDAGNALAVLKQPDLRAMDGRRFG